MHKSEARRQFTAQRMALSSGEWAQGSQRLAHLFFIWLPPSVRVLHTYLPIEAKREPDTWLLIDRLRREYGHIRLALPRVAGSTLQHYYYEGGPLPTNSWGIAEPQGGLEVPLEKIDLVIVPLLAADQRGQRVGYGRGFYDRFLALCRPDCHIVGLSFFEPIDQLENIHPGDIPLRTLITPTQIIEIFS